MKVIGVIPARGGSKGILRKNVEPLAGSPLISWTIRTALDSKSLTTVCVSSDDPEIIDTAKRYGITDIVLRPEFLATDTALAIPTIQHAVKAMEDIKGSVYDLVVMLQPTCPLRSATDVDQSIQLLKDQPNGDSVISIVGVGNNHPMKMKVFNEYHLLENYAEPPVENPPRQILPPVFIVNGAIYATRRNILFEKNSFSGDRALGYLMPDSRSVNIDVARDFMAAEYEVNRQSLIVPLPVAAR